MFDFLKDKPFKCFNEEYGDLTPVSRSYQGIEAVPLEKIVGTVGRCHDKQGSWSEIKDTGRFRGIKNAMEKMETFPAIKVYKVDDEYYIVDGHHRVMAGREVGKKFIDAEVYKYQFDEDKTSSDYSDCPRKVFEEKTGLQGILLDSKEKYNKLLNYIEKFGQKLNISYPLEKISQLWYHKDFLSFVEKNDSNNPDEKENETDSEKYCEEKCK